jgi:hypothetical protein
MAYTQQTPIGTPDVNLITKTLANLRPDTALQEYAALHKNNPYILSLAKSESDRRKSLRLAAQGDPGQQPTIVDQNIAGMAPAPMMAQTQLSENQGIAQLPTPNIRTLADGGIAGYEDDEEGMATGGMGGMFNFAQQSEPVVRMSGGGAVPRYQGNTVDGSVVSSNPMFSIPGMTAVQPRTEFTQQGAPENTPFFQRVLEDVSSSNKARQLAMIEQKIVQGTATTEEKVYFQTEMSKKSGKPQAAAPKDTVNPDDVLMAAEKAGRFKPPADKAPADKPPAPQAALPTSYKPTKAPTIDEAIAQGDKFFNSKKRIGDIERQVLQEQMDADKTKENSIEALKAFNEKQGPAYAGYEKLLQKEELQDATDKEKSGLMSLMKGFLAMAAGESPNAATNIAKGAMVGLGDYGDALKEFKKAAKERNKEMQNIQQARRAEERGDFKEERMYEDKAATARQASARFGIAAINDITNAGGKASSDIFNTMLTNTSRENIAKFEVGAANARAQTPDKMVFDALVRQNNGDTVKAAEALQKMKAEKFNVYEAYSKYLTGFAGKENLMKGPDDFDVFAKRFIPEVNPNKNTTIRTQPGG